MQVTPISHTTLTGAITHYDIEDWMELDLDSSEADALAEFAGRACYQSFHKPNPSTEANRDYLANILTQEHESVLEHASISFYVTGVSRALTHELIRHRHLSFSELSQRFVDVQDAEMVYPPALREGDLWQVDNLFGQVRNAYREAVKTLTGRGLNRKKAREAARSVMPNATETRIVVTGNVRAWRWVIKKRWHTAADAEIQEFAGHVLRHLREFAPNSVQDIPEEPYS